MAQQVPISSLRQGDIVYAVLDDGRGGVKKKRPAVVLSYTEDIKAGERVVVAAITTKIPDPTPPNKIVLPYSPCGASHSRLRVRCAVVTNWLRYIDGDSVVETNGGYLSDALVSQILDQIDGAP